MVHTPSVPGDFDVLALLSVVDAQREAQHMTWTGLAKSLNWFGKDAIDRMRASGSASCNHVLPMIQWVGRTPESFTVDPDGAVHELLPEPGGTWRWWWNQRELSRELDIKRADKGLSWQ